MHRLHEQVQLLLGAVDNNDQAGSYSRKHEHCIHPHLEFISRHSCNMLLLTAGGQLINVLN